jgi:hypothetical protein
MPHPMSMDAHGRGQFYPGACKFALELARFGVPRDRKPPRVAVLTARAREFKVGGSRGRAVIGGCPVPCLRWTCVPAVRASDRAEGPFPCFPCMCSLRWS